MMKKNITLLTIAIATIGIVAMAPVILDSILSQKVYAPAGSRGLFQADMSPMGSGAYLYASDYMIVPCDDVKVLNAAYEKYMNSVFA
jgi:hypothetical protein